MGLELKPSKTRICHSLEEYNGEKAGIDFLGFNIRHYPTGKAKSPKSSTGKTLGYTLRIKPSKEKVKLHLAKLKEVIKSHKAAPQAAMIKVLNPIIQGWSKYYSTVVSKETLSYCDHMLWQKLRAWAKRRHSNKNIHFIANKYWKTVQGRKVFTTREDGGYTLVKHDATPTKRFVKVQNSRSPYDGDWVYWSSRMGKNPLISNRVAALLKKQKGKCPHCNGYLKTTDLMEVDHIIPRSKGGTSKLDNLQLLHRQCHDTTTALDMKVDGCINDNDYLNEERNEVKVSRSVLKTSRSGDASA
jgi:RNA-directed DNA polymerase